MSFAVPLPTLSAAFGDIVRALARRVCDIVFKDRSAGPLLSEMTLKLNGLTKRFNAIVERVQAGTLRAPPRRRAEAMRVATRTVSQRRPSLVPNRFQWLSRLAPEANAYGHYLDQMVRTDLEMVALLTAAPQAKGILRSLYWMLGRRPLPDILRRAKAPPRAIAACTVPVRPVPVSPVGKPIPTDTGHHRYQPSARWPKGCVTHHPRALAKPRASAKRRGRAKPRATAGPPSGA